MWTLVPVVSLSMSTHPLKRRTISATLVKPNPGWPSRVLMSCPPLQFGHAPSEFALNNAGLTPLAFANALRIGSKSPV